MLNLGPNPLKVFFAVGAAVLLWLLTVWTPPACAAYANYNNVLMGERAAGLGGAYTALAADPAATPFTNPATTILQEGSSFAGSIHVFNKFVTTIGQSGDFIDAPARLNQGYFRSLPSASGIILNFKTYAVGLSILVPDADYFAGQIAGSSNTLSSLNMSDQSLWVGATGSTRLTPVDSVGASLYYTARNFTREVYDRLSTTATAATITNEEKSISSNNLVAVLGYHRKIGDFWTVGVSYRPPSLLIASEGSYYRETTQTTPYADQAVNRSGLKAVTLIPQKLAIGIAREEQEHQTISADVHIYGALNYKDFPDFDQGADDLHYRTIANFAIGYEQFVRKWLSMRMGAYTNLAPGGSPDSSTGYRQLDHVDLYGFSANLNLRAHEQTSFTFGGYYSGGSGLSTQYVGNSVRVITKSQQIFTMLVGTGFHF